MLLESVEQSEEIGGRTKGVILDSARNLRAMGYSKARVYKLMSHLKKVGFGPIV